MLVLMERQGMGLLEEAYGYPFQHRNLWVIDRIRKRYTELLRQGLIEIPFRDQIEFHQNGAQAFTEPLSFWAAKARVSLS